MDDTPNKVLERVVVALGGTKQIAPRLWPDKTIDDARRLLCDCLNDERPAKLDLSQVLFILRLAKDHGVHEGMHFVADSVGYSRPTPVEPEDERATLQREYIEAARQMAKVAQRMEALMAPTVRAVA
jgi:hypothetical protein